MEAKTLNPVQSRNTVAELLGSRIQKKYVLISGHLDSWDVGVGAMDDGGGVFISWYALILLKKLGLRPRRTIRAVLWTGEEQGVFGALAYQKAHLEKNMVFLMESDEGTFNPEGIIFKGTSEAQCMMEEIMNLMSPLNATDLVFSSGPGSDITVWAESPIPMASLNNANERYFWFHHSDGDKMTVQNSKALDKCLALWTSVAYIVADLFKTLPQ